MPSSEPREFFSCDWGTTSFRLRRVDLASGAIHAEVKEAVGVRTISTQASETNAHERAAAFTTFLGSQWQRIKNPSAPPESVYPIVISGMASSSVGWREVPYARAPFSLDGSSVSYEAFDISLEATTQARVYLIAGVRTEREVMRGEETEILGLFHGDRFRDVAENGWVILPGTHSKHVRLSERAITTWRTFMTGELFDVLATHSLLRVSVESSPLISSARLPESESIRSAFLDGVQAARDPGWAPSLFQVRTRTVLDGVPPSVNRWFLSGLLIGAELIHLIPSAPDLPLLLAAPALLSELYRLAAEALLPEHRLLVAPPQEMAEASVRGHALLLRRWGGPSPQDRPEDLPQRPA